MSSVKALNEKDKRQAYVMVQAGVSAAKVSKMFNCSDQTVLRSCKYIDSQIEQAESSGLVNPDSAAVLSDVAAIKERYSNQCQAVMSKIVSYLTPEKFAMANLKDSAIAYGIFTDKLCNFRQLNAPIDHRIQLVAKIRTTQKD